MRQSIFKIALSEIGAAPMGHNDEIHQAQAFIALQSRGRVGNVQIIARINIRSGDDRTGARSDIDFARVHRFPDDAGTPGLLYFFQQIKTPSLHIFLD